MGRAAALVALSALLFACSGDVDEESPPDVPDIEETSADPEPDPDPEPEPEPEPGPEPEPEDPQESDPEAYDGFPIDEPIPDVSAIDEAYVNEVLRVLDENHAQLVRRVRELEIADASSENYASVLRELTITATQSLEPQLFDRVLDFESEGWFQADLDPPRSEVTNLIAVSDECIAVAIQLDAQPFYAAPLDGTWYLGLEPREALLIEAGTYWRFAAIAPSTGEELNYCE